MKKLLLLLSLILALLAPAVAQQWTPLSPQAQNEAAALITRQVKSVNAMSCRFQQSKHSPYLTQDATAEGKMQYAKPNAMRWEYTAPIQYAIVVNGDSIRMVKDGKTQEQKGSQKRIMNGMMKMIMGISTGNNLFDEKSFQVAISESKTQYQALLTPKNKSLKRMFSQIEMVFDKKNSQIVRLLLTEKDQSVTTIVFSNVAAK